MTKGKNVIVSDDL
jgi:hypothetical protein